MKSRHLSLFIFVDALGGDILSRHPFLLRNVSVERRRLATIFGYSSACDPSIISGRLPNEHRMWSSFYYAPDTSPFRPLRFLDVLPSRLVDRGRVRGWLSKIIKRAYGFTGYFQIYNVPFAVLPYFDYAEKRSIWREGLIRGTTIFDHLRKEGIPYVVEPGGAGDDVLLDRFENALDGGARFAYICLGNLDACLHRCGTEHAEVEDLLRWYDRRLGALLERVGRAYDSVTWYLFSDHGMHDVVESCNLPADIAALNLTYGQDYVAFYDATMARFWFLNDRARSRITRALRNHTMGRIVPDDELRDMGVWFEDAMYGELIFLMQSGVMIAPGFMGKEPVPGMHGFHPSDSASDAAIVSNKKLPARVRRIEQIYDLMLEDLGMPLAERSVQGPWRPLTPGACE